MPHIFKGKAQPEAIIVIMSSSFSPFSSSSSFLSSLIPQISQPHTTSQLPPNPQKSSSSPSFTPNSRTRKRERNRFERGSIGDEDGLAEEEETLAFVSGRTSLLPDRGTSAHFL
ncbi:Response regulatory domain-containing protein [Psidium guajava]|nr:Response regulatory domain-containing protein [Psidium guajava]